MLDMNSHIFIVGGTFNEAVRWCRNNGVKPFARTTHILTTGDSVRGLTIHPQDRILWHEGVVDERIIENILIAQMVYPSSNRKHETWCAHGQ